MPRDQFLGGPTYWKSEPLCVSHGTRHSDVQIVVLPLGEKEVARHESRIFSASPSQKVS